MGPSGRQLEVALDRLLTAQLVVAWAGEGGQSPRLGWWDTQLISRYGGHDLFQRLAPQTWRWAALQAAREVARRIDAERRARHAKPDRVISLYCWGFEVDELLDERLQDLKRSSRQPVEVLPDLKLIDGQDNGEVGSSPSGERDWGAVRFAEWVDDLRPSDATPFEVDSIGRRIDAVTPAELAQAEVLRRLVGLLVGALCSPAADRGDRTLPADYPFPYIERAREATR